MYVPLFTNNTDGISLISCETLHRHQRSIGSLLFMNDLIDLRLRCALYGSTGYDPEELCESSMHLLTSTDVTHDKHRVWIMWHLASSTDFITSSIGSLNMCVSHNTISTNFVYGWVNRGPRDTVKGTQLPINLQCLNLNMAYKGTGGFY